MNESTFAVLENLTGKPSGASKCLARTVSPGTVDYFRSNWPVMLDGALVGADDRAGLVKRARHSLLRGRVDPEALPQEILREALEGVASAPMPATRAGFVAVGPFHGRIWWDRTVTDNLDDILARLDDPRLVLRFYDVTGLEPGSGRWNDVFDVDVELEDAGKTVHFWADDRSYLVDFGYVYADGRFLRLARTTVATLPRSGAGRGDDGETARTLLGRRSGDGAGEFVPDEAARKWAAARADGEGRDIEAELFIHMLYRAFLEVGPRVMRRAAVPAYRDAATLREEYLLRRRERTVSIAGRGTGVLAARLDGERVSVPEAARYPVAAVGAGVVPLATDGRRFLWHEGLLRACRMAEPEGDSAVAARVREVVPEAVEATLVKPLGAVWAMEYAHTGMDMHLSRFSRPVFEAARNLRESLSGRGRPESGAVWGVASAADGERSVRGFGGFEAKRLMKVGVRISRVSVVLEGRMRPGARFKVAGKLVRTDREGNFRLECVLSGRRAGIPLRAGASSGGEVRSVINVDWDKRPAGDHRKVESRSYSS